MLTSYFKTAWRNLKRQKGYAALNLVGLAVALAACLVIGLYVWQEWQYDRFHKHADRIIRIQLQETPVTPSIIAPLFKRTFPEVEEAVRLYDVGSFRPQVVRYGERVFQEEHFVYADSTIFDVFTLPLIAGNPETALNRPRSLVLSASMAKKYFREEDPVGQTLQVGAQAAYEVTGVFEDLPSYSHLQFHFLASFSTLRWDEEEIWSSANFLTYLLLRDPQDVETLEPKVEQLLVGVRAAGQVSATYELGFVPLTRIYLGYEGGETYVYLFSTIALLILLIACANYMNLATAQSARRAREVGVRKAVGANRGQLIRQFYGESALLVVMSILLSLLLARMARPLLETLGDKELALWDLAEPGFLIALLGIGVVVTLLAGSYPALLLSSFHPSRIFNTGAHSPRGGARFRQGLVIFQFAICVFFIASTAVVYHQLRFVQTKSLGFDKEHVVVLPLGDDRLHEVRERMAPELEQQANVLGASAINRIPGYQISGYSLTIEGLQLPTGEFFPITGVPTDLNVVETLGLELVAGPGFTASDAYEPQPGNYVYLVNEETIRQLGWTPEEAIGKRMTLSGDNRMGTLVGVFENYHFLSLHEPIRPMAFFVEPQSANYLLVRIAPGATAGTLSDIREVWNRFATHRPFEYTFLDQQIDTLYRNEQQMGRLFAAFSLLAVLIASLGLFGLAAYAAEERTTEIGIRKILGASAASIVALLTRDLLKLVLLGFLFATPIAYYATGRWLDGFSYHINLGPGVFMLAGGIALAIALLAVSYQALRAAWLNPTEAIRQE